MEPVLDTDTPTAEGTERALTGQRRDGVWLFVQQFVQMGLFTLCRIPLWTQAATVAPRGPLLALAGRQAGEEDGAFILKGLTAVMRNRGCCLVAEEKEGGGTFA